MVEMLVYNLKMQGIYQLHILWYKHCFFIKYNITAILLQMKGYNKMVKDIILPFIFTNSTLNLY